MESMEQTFTGNADFGRKVSCLVARNGDLIHKAYLQIDLPPLTANTGGTVAWTRQIGHVILDEISVEIGGAIIDRHYGMWYTIYNELTQVYEKEDTYMVMIGNTAVLTTPASTIPAASLYVPLIFWFNKNPGLNRNPENNNPTKMFWISKQEPKSIRLHPNREKRCRKNPLEVLTMQNEYLRC